MKLSEVKRILSNTETVAFKLESGASVPEHFHVTEVGLVTKHFIDCGGTVRNEKTANFQLWDANDYDHRLKPGKLLKIIALSEKTLGLADDLEVEVEYQSETIGKYHLGYDGSNFTLLSTRTNCLALDKCGVPAEKTELSFISIGSETACTPGSGCC